MKLIYRRLLSRCRTVNELNRLHTRLENRMTPMDVPALKEGLPPIPFFRIRKRSAKSWSELKRKLGSSRPPAGLSEFRRNWAAKTWIEGLEARVRLSGKTVPEPFVRRQLSGGIRLYTSGGDRSRKTLMVAYTGNAQRFMMPLAVFLQHLDAANVDIAVFSDRRKNGYRSGVACMGNTLQASISAMSGLLEMASYRNVVSFGTSGGGIPAVMTALQLGLNRAMSVGGNSPDDPRWRDFNGIGLRKVIERCCSRLDEVPEIYLVFGAHSPLDREKAETLAALVPAEVIAVENQNSKVEHNALFPLVQQGRLSEFLDRTIFRDIFRRSALNNVESIDSIRACRT